MPATENDYSILGMFFNAKKCVFVRFIFLFVSMKHSFSTAVIVEFKLQLTSVETVTLVLSKQFRFFLKLIFLSRYVDIAFESCMHLIDLSYLPTKVVVR